MSAMFEDNVVELVYLEGLYSSDNVDTNSDGDKPLVIIDPRNGDTHGFNYVDPEVAKSCPNETYRFWFQLKLHHDPPHGPIGYVQDSVHKAVDAVVRQLPSLGHIDGVVGFSQGANLAVILCAMAEAGLLRASFPRAPKMALLFAPSNFGWAEEVSKMFRQADGSEPLFKQQILVPSLIVTGRQDPGFERSKDTLGFFRNAQHLVHPGGHTIPTEAKDHARCIEIIRDFIINTHAIYNS